MLKETLIELYDRDLQKLNTEIGLYRDEEKLWELRPGISNSAGNLCLHLLGNLNHFIGATLGNTGYIRHREDEFALKHIPRQDLVLNIANCNLIVKTTLEKMSDGDFEKEYPLEMFGRRLSTTHMLVHLVAHLDYHLGQINYHRRLIEP